MMVELLELMKGRKSFEYYYSSLAIAGDKDDIGFFSNFGRGTVIEKNARIKSGLIKKVRSHSGYLQNRKGEWIAFSMIANNFNGNHKKIDTIHKKVLIMLAQ